MIDSYINLKNIKSHNKFLIIVVITLLILIFITFNINVDSYDTLVQNKKNQTFNKEIVKKKKTSLKNEIFNIFNGKEYS